MLRGTRSKRGIRGEGGIRDIRDIRGIGGIRDIREISDMPLGVECHLVYPRGASPA